MLSFFATYATPTASFPLRHESQSFLKFENLRI
jgi:hypothetical protein